MTCRTMTWADGIATLRRELDRQAALIETLDTVADYWRALAHAWQDRAAGRA